MKKLTSLCALVLLVAGVTAMGQPEEGLVLHYTFHEGAGDVLHDRSGNNNDGKIHGAKWVKNGPGFALEFDGKDDHVDCGAGPSLDLRGQVSMMAWVRAEPQKGAGEPGIIGKAYESYVITQYYGNAYTYISGTSGSTSAPISFGRWQHIASTYDGAVLTLYIDGKAASTRELDIKTAEGGRFWMGRSDGVLVCTQNAHFRGRITEVSVYNKALTPEQIALHAATTNLTNTLDLALVPLPWKNELLVEVDKRGLGPDSGRARVDLKVYRGSKPKLDGPSLLKGSLKDFAGTTRAWIRLSASDLTPGKYSLIAVARNSLGRRAGVPATAEFTWEEMPQYPQGPPGARKLNNLVTELLNVPGPDASGKAFTFTNPRTGWLYFANRGADRVTLTIPGQAEPRTVPLDRQYRGARETMHYLPAGRYTISIPKAQDLIVRAVPELIFARYDREPHVSEFGPYRGAFLNKHVLPHVNTFVGAASVPFAKEWQQRGGRWLATCSVPKGTEEKPLTVHDAYKFIAENADFNAPQVAGLIADEFGNSAPYNAPWAKAIDRILAEPRYKNKVYYPYATNLWTGEPGRELVAALVRRHSGIAWKCYLKEQATEAAARRHLDLRIITSANNYREKCPGSLPRISVCFGYFSAPPEQLDTFPHVNYKTWLEMQFNLVACHPSCRDMGGLMTYLASYVDEEVVRWGAILFRHYGIEGRTDMMSGDPYVLSHIDNSDFVEKGRGWALAPAAEGSIRFAISPGFGWLQGRYPRTAEVDNVIITRRSAEKPNVFSQKIKNLQPGRTYSLRMFTGDFNDLSVKQTYAMSVRIDGVETLTDRSFTHINANCYSHSYGPYDRENKAWMNYHWRVFRARGTTARLTVSDWKSDNEPGGPIGQELMYNFIEVQPYFE